MSSPGSYKKWRLKWCVFHWLKLEIVCVCARVCWVSRVREWETSFSPQRATATSSNMIDANINILTFTATLWGSTKNTHGEEREEEKRAIRQSAFTQHHTHTPHAHHVWSQWAAEVYWSFQQEEEEWKQENSSEVMKQGHCFSCINVFCVFDLLEVTGIFHDLCCQEALTFDLCTIVECRVKINEVLWPRGFILRAHADFNMWEFKKHDMIVAVVVLTLLSWLLTGRRTTPCLILSIISFTAFDFTSSTPSAARERILLYILHI